jgi:glycosyltransferase involved in cell wall biosynthesis
MLNATHKITSGINTPKVSVIIPVYNVERYLRECLDTVINQTLKDIEIILIDDGSSDNTAKVAESLGVSKVVRLKHHSGLSKTFIAGLSAAIDMGADIIVNTGGETEQTEPELPC